MNDEDFFRWSMAAYGAPISCEKQYTTKAELNQLLKKALEYGRKSAEINSILPVFIYKNKDSFDWNLIISSTKEKAYLGYLLNTIHSYRDTPDLAEIYAQLYKQASPMRKKFLIQKEKIGKFIEKRMNENDNEIAKTWRFKTLDSLENNKKRFEKWL
ncbi:MAG: hypothetical protein AAF518_15330 [Spirochaetota bacterium]